jgi:Pentapeptide repeats (8 copies)
VSATDNATDKASSRDRIREVLRDPHWWWHEVFTALIVGLVIASGTIVGQKLVDDSRAAREDVTIAAEFRHNEQAADLRFVREQSSPQQHRARPFSKFDLEGQNLVGLSLAGADLTAADLTGANLSHANLAEAKLTAANLTDVFYDERTTWPDGFTAPLSRAAP